jgi:hypothetical protein
MRLAGFARRLECQIDDYLDIEPDHAAVGSFALPDAEVAAVDPRFAVHSRDAAGHAPLNGTRTVSE